jgi:CHRD domain
MRKLVGVGASLLLLLAVAGLAAAGQNGNYSVHLNGDTEVPANASKAAGQAIFDLSPDGTSLDYVLIVANLDNPVAAHIHVGPPGVNGPVVVFLFGPAAPGVGPRTACSRRARSPRRISSGRLPVSRSRR